MRRTRTVVIAVLLSVPLSAWVAPMATAAAQTVTTSPVTDVTQSSATAHCGVDTTIRTQVFVKYGPVGSTQLKSAVQFVYDPTSDVAFALSGLTGGTTYAVQCRAYNSTYGTKTGATVTFQASGGAPPPPPPPPPPGNGTTIVL